MPRVFKGKVIIPGDQLENYLRAMEAAEKAREPFRRYLEGLRDEFASYLSTKYSKRTVGKHVGIVDMFIWFLCRYTDVESIEEITRGIANSHFRQWYKRKVLDSASAEDLRIALKKFFLFLEREKGIKNTKVLESLM